MAHSCDVDELFRLYTLPQNEFAKSYLLLDVRENKQWKRAHLIHAFNVRFSSSNRTLKSEASTHYTTPWSTDVWVGRQVYVYGDAGLKKDHEVVKYLASSGCASVSYLKEGFAAFEKAYPFVSTASVKAGSWKAYPSQILPGLLYLGDWSHAENQDRLADLHVKGVVTVHNHPENLAKHIAKGTRWLQWELPDIDAADVASCFNKTYEFIEEARQRKEAVLVHCGAGVSRSATLVMQYLMRRFSWSAQKAKDHCVERRSVVCPNDGFWRTLCALEPTLGITTRSNPDAMSHFHGLDAAEAVLDGENRAAVPSKLSVEVVGGKVPIQALTPEQAAKRKRELDVKSGDDTERGAKRQNIGQGQKGVLVVLEVRKPEGVVQELVIGPIGPHQKVILGRLPSNDIVLEHASISRQHASLSSDTTGAVHLTDLASGHGTKLDDVWIRPKVAKQLKKGSVMYFGASTRSYKVADIQKE